MRRSNIDLHRTFKPAAADETGDEPDVSRLFAGDRRLRWSDLHGHAKRTVVLIGEAGVGKTVELSMEVQRLKTAGQFAFFVELSDLGADEDWRRQVTAHEYDAWTASDAVGHFFLDAVDEARLTSTASLSRALAVVHAALRPFLNRVRIVLSSRISDWALAPVRDLVEDRLADPIARAAAAPDDDPMLSGGEAVDEEEGDGNSLDSKLSATMLVVRLEGLSPAEAKRYARHAGLADEKGFWDAVDAGDYRFMTALPLDLDWLVRRWNDTRRLGELLELLESNIEARLDEVNPSHRDSERHLPRRELRAGAERIAAAAVFGGHRSMSIGGSAVSLSVSAYEVLDDWHPLSVDHLLGTALFDEPTFGRVKFHHRTVREYLAACWVDNYLLAVGVSLPRVMGLFEAKPFGETVLIASRRWTLCWLGALNARVRERLARHHPEMIVFDGDPMAWDSATAVSAFEAYIRKLAEDYRPDWINSAQELGRVGRRLPPGRIASMLADRSLGDRARSQVIGIAFHASLADCAPALFQIFGDEASDYRTRVVALQALSEIATNDQRDAVARALLGGRLDGNAMIAAGLRVARLSRFSIEDLRSILLSAGNEAPYGSGHMARTIRDDLLPSAGWQELVALLDAVLNAMPSFAERDALPRRGEDPPARAWTLDVLPDLCIAALELVQANQVDGEAAGQDTLLRALVELQRLRDSQYVEASEITRISQLIESSVTVRWALAHRFFGRQELDFSITWMTMGRGRSLIVFHAADLKQLIARANDPQDDAVSRSKLFRLAHQVAWQVPSPPQRRVALRMLIAGPDADDRRAHIFADLAKLRHNRRLLREHRLQDAKRDSEQATAMATLRAFALQRIDALRSGSDTETLVRLTLRTRFGTRPSSAAGVIAAIQRELGTEVADAVAEGLRVLWSVATVPNPRDRQDGRVPWLVLLLQLAWDLKRRDGPVLDRASVARAARIATWSPDRPPRWLEALLSTSPAEAVESLSPWLAADAASEHEAPASLDALEMALRAGTRTRATLLTPLKQSAVDGTIGRATIRRHVLRAMHEDAVLKSEELGAVIASELRRWDVNHWTDETAQWLCLWLRADIAGAWAWLTANLPLVGQAHDVARQCIRKVSGDVFKAGRPAGVAEARTMVQIYQFILADEKVVDHSSLTGTEPAEWSEAALQAFASALSEMPGVNAAHEGLLTLSSADPARRAWLQELAERQARLSAELTADIPLAELKGLAATFSCTPVDPGRLYQQVIERLEDLRVSIEEGPYSEAVLFMPGMEESQLQVWLAARIASFGNRRFAVTREEVLHRKKRSDVQVVCSGGKVCIEVKPLDKGRYTVAELVETLKVQIVEQYLIGHNSRHGILLLIMLKQRRWRIPGHAGGRDLGDLTRYLQEQANAIAGLRGDIEKLTVFAIDASGGPPASN